MPNFWATNCMANRYMLWFCLSARLQHIILPLDLLAGCEAHLKTAVRWPSLPCTHICPPGGGWAGRSSSACARYMAQYPWLRPAAGSWCDLSSPWFHPGSPLNENNKTGAATRTKSWSINIFGHQSVGEIEKICVNNSQGFIFFSYNMGS